MAKKLISLIIPAYNEEDCVDELAKRLKAVFHSEPQYDFEAVIVENGSLDATWDLLKVIALEDRRFKMVKLSRNFRMDGGLTAGVRTPGDDGSIRAEADRVSGTGCDRCEIGGRDSWRRNGAPGNWPEIGSESHAATGQG